MPEAPRRPAREAFRAGCRGTGRESVEGSQAAVAALVLLAFVGTLGYRATIPVASFYARSVLGVSALGVGALTAAFYLLRAGAAAGSGLASSTARRAGLLAGASFAAHVGVVAYLAAGPGYAGLLAVRGLQGLLNGLAWTSSQILLAASTPTRYRGRAFAVYGITGSLGALAGDLLYRALGARCLAVSASAFAASSAMALWLSKLSLAIDRATEAPGTPRGIGGVSPLALLAAVAAVAYASVMGVGDIAYVYYREVLHISPGDAAALRGTAAFLGTLAGYLLGWLADAGSPLAALALAYAAAAAGMLAVPVPSLYVAGLGIALITAAGRAALPTARKIASELPRGRVYLGLLGAVTNIASAAGGLAYGLAYKRLGTATLALDGVRLVEAPLLASLWAVLLPPLLLAASIASRHARKAR